MRLLLFDDEGRLKAVTEIFWWTPHGDAILDAYMAGVKQTIIRIRRNEEAEE